MASNENDCHGLIIIRMMSGLVIDNKKEHFLIAKPTVAKLIFDGLKEFHFTQKQLAEKLGVSTACVNNFVSGKSEPNLSHNSHESTQSH